MARESGRSMIKNLIFILIVAYVGFVIFKLISSTIEKTAIKSEVFNRLGENRTEGEEFIRAKIISVLENKGVTPISVTVTTVNRNLNFSYTYEMETDYMITKLKAKVSVSDSMANHY